MAVDEPLHGGVRLAHVVNVDVQNLTRLDSQLSHRRLDLGRH